MADEQLAVHRRDVQDVEQTRGGDHAGEIQLIGPCAIEVRQVGVTEGAFGGVAGERAANFTGSATGVVGSGAPLVVIAIARCCRVPVQLGLLVKVWMFPGSLSVIDTVALAGRAGEVRGVRDRMVTITDSGVMGSLGDTVVDGCDGDRGRGLTVGDGYRRTQLAPR